MNIVQALDDPSVFRGVIRDHTTWGAWRGFLKALFGLPMTEAEAELFRACTGRVTASTAAFEAAWLVCGRRGGKSFALALIAVFLAAFRDFKPYLALGERATIVIVAADRKQARVIFRYARGILKGVPALGRLLDTETADELRLTNGVNIEIMTASSRTLRGYSVPVALLDEAAFWTVEGAADADSDIISALKPAMRQFPARMLLAASSPYARRGALWAAYKAHYGRDESTTLVWQAPTWTMNPTISRADLAEDFAQDPARAESEYGASFRTDLEDFVSREVVDAAVVSGRHELPPVPGVHYKAFTDPSGAGADAMTLAIAHHEGGRAVLDAVRVKKPPFSPAAVVEEFAALLKTYRIDSVTGDHWGGQFVQEPFRLAGINYERSEKVRSDIYLEFLPMLNSGKVELLDHPGMLAELINLERRTARSGKDSVNHPPGGHDDAINAVAGSLLSVSTSQGDLEVWAQLGAGGFDKFLDDLVRRY